jgi:hypothetical protein
MVVRKKEALAIGHQERLISARAYVVMHVMHVMHVMPRAMDEERNLYSIRAR